jgi:hypothetical protein
MSKSYRSVGGKSSLATGEDSGATLPKQTVSIMTIARASGMAFKKVGWALYMVRL